MKNNTFHKKVYSFRLFFKDIFFLMSNIGKLHKLSKNKYISNSFREKIMTVVSSINGCTYCKWFHAKQSVKSGISSSEVKKLLNLQFDTAVDDFELTGILFSQHYAETDRKPEQFMLKKLNDEYGKQNAEAIILNIRLVFLGNLYGNTLDAFVSRLKGKKAENSSFIFEALFFLFNSPFYIFLKIVTQKDK